MPTIKFTQTVKLSDKEVEILRHLSQNGTYTWYSNDHLGKHPFDEHQCRSLIANGYVYRGSDYNFGDVYVYITTKGKELLAALDVQEGGKLND